MVIRVAAWMNIMTKSNDSTIFSLVSYLVCGWVISLSIAENWVVRE